MDFTPHRAGGCAYCQDIKGVNEDLRKFDFKGNRIVNYEMETSALYGLSSLMGHEACTVCAVVANRYANSFSKDYKPVMNSLIENSFRTINNFVKKVRLFFSSTSIDASVDLLKLSHF